MLRKMRSFPHLNFITFSVRNKKKEFQTNPFYSALILWIFVFSSLVSDSNCYLFLDLIQYRHSKSQRKGQAARGSSTPLTPRVGKTALHKFNWWRWRAGEKSEWTYEMNEWKSRWMNEWINESLNQSINQLIDQSTNRLMRRLINRSISQLINRSINKQTNFEFYYWKQYLT